MTAMRRNKLFCGNLLNKHPDTYLGAYFFCYFCKKILYMTIKQIEIKDFWKKFNIKWKLNPDVNILTGINGAGKSTLLDLIACIIVGSRLPKAMLEKASMVKIKFDEDEATIVNINFNDSYLNLTKKAQEDEIFKELQEDVEDDFVNTSRKSRLNSLMLNASISYVTTKTKGKIPAKEFLSNLNIDVISTFDEPLSYIEDKTKWDSLHEEGVWSSLDKELHELQEQYSYYIGNLANTIEKMVLSGVQPKIEALSNLYAPKNLFIKIINELFNSTGKIIDTDKSKLGFKIIEDDIPISIYELSSGEKQMLYILWKVLLQNQEPYILFLDEPEISLHVDWQELLIEKIRLLNPNCQVLIATHAPSVLLDGWQPFVTNIDDIKFRNQKK